MPLRRTLAVAALALLPAGAHAIDGICVDRETGRPCSGGGAPPARRGGDWSSPAPAAPSKADLVREGEGRWAEREDGLRSRWQGLMAPLGGLEAKLAEPVDAHTARVLIGRNSPAFGLGGRETPSLPAAPRVQGRRLESLGERLACAFHLSQAAYAALPPMGGVSAEQFEEVAYLADESLGALAGLPLGLPCPSAAPPPHAPERRAEQLRDVVARTLRTVDQVRTADGVLAALAWKEGELILPDAPEPERKEVLRLKRETAKERAGLVADLRKDAQAEVFLREASEELQGEVEKARKAP
jgi:hypothetical protein